MAAEINSRRPFLVKLIQFTDGSTLENRAVFIAGEFLIVEAETEDQAPTWYNIKNVEFLQEVEVDKKQESNGIRIMRFG